MSSEGVREGMLFGFRGVFVGIIGLIGLHWPQSAEAGPIALFGVFALAYGGFAILVSHVGGAESRRWWGILPAGAGIVAGSLMLAWPGLTISQFVSLVAAWFACLGLLDILNALGADNDLTIEWRASLGGLLTMGSAAFIALYPRAAVLGVVSLLGAYVLLFGGLLVLLGARLGNRTAVDHERRRQTRGHLEHAPSGLRHDR